MMIRALVLAFAYAGLWFVIGRAIPNWITVAVAALWLPLAEHFHLIRGTTSPSSTLVLIMVIGGLGALAGRAQARRPRPTSN